MSRVFSFAISPVCSWKYPCCCFSSYFCFLVIVILFVLMLPLLLLAVVISLSLLFLMYSLSFSIAASTQSRMQENPLLPSFLGTYRLSILSLLCKVLCIVLNFVISFLVFWSICWSSFPHPFQECSRVSYKGDSPGVYPFDKLPSAELGFEKFSRSSEVLFSYFFFHFPVFDGVRFQFSQVLVIFLFSKRSDFYFDLVVLLIPLFTFFRFSLLAWNLFYAKFHSYILTV